MKEALNNLKYSDSSKSFEENLEAAIFNVVGNYGLKIIGNIYQSTNGSIDKLNKIAKMIRSDSWSISLFDYLNLSLFRKRV